VDVFPSSQAVTAVGGRPLRPDEPQWDKVDHCQFEEIQSLQSPCSEVITTAQRCLDQCVQNCNCNGVNVVPMWLPQTVYPLWSNRVAMPYDTMGMCPQGLFGDLREGSRVCYGVEPRQPNSTFSSYSVTDDPEDPLWYSTCYNKRPQWAFDLSLASATNATIVVVPPSWSFADKCVDCVEWKSTQETKLIPHWNIPSECRDCTAENLPPLPPAPGSIIARGIKCDGSYDGQTNWNYHNVATQCQNQRCVKTLSVAGANGGVTSDECVQMALDDPECTEWVHRDGVNKMDASAGSTTRAVETASLATTTSGTGIGTSGVPRFPSVILPAREGSNLPMVCTAAPRNVLRMEILFACRNQPCK